MTEQEIKEHLTWCMYISEDLHKTRLEILYPYIGSLTKIFIHHFSVPFEERIPYLQSLEIETLKSIARIYDLIDTSNWDRVEYFFTNCSISKDKKVVLSIENCLDLENKIKFTNLLLHRFIMHNEPGSYIGYEYIGHPYQCAFVSYEDFEKNVYLEHIQLEKPKMFLTTKEDFYRNFWKSNTYGYEPDCKFMCYN